MTRLRLRSASESSGSAASRNTTLTPASLISTRIPSPRERSFDSGAPLVHIPCYGAASHLLTTTAELDAYVRPQGAIGEYLSNIFRDHKRAVPLGRTKEIWDLSATSYLINEHWSTKTQRSETDVVGGHDVDTPTRRRSERPVRRSKLRAGAIQSSTTSSASWPNSTPVNGQRDSFPERAAISNGPCSTTRRRR